MIAAIHQPQYLPWLGYFDKIASADIFILLDNVQFKKNEWQNRNKIRTPQGWQWFTVPVIHNFGQLISEVKINNQTKWRDAHLKALCLNYKRSPFFDTYIEEFKNIYSQNWKNLADLNIFLIKKIVSWIGIQTKIFIASEYQVTEDSTQRLIDLCRIAGADTYLSGIDGGKYMDFDKFRKNNIEVMTQNFCHPRYEQVWSGKDNENFISHMSVIDLLFNCGKGSLSVIKGEQGVNIST